MKPPLFVLVALLALQSVCAQTSDFLFTKRTVNGSSTTFAAQLLSVSSGLLSIDGSGNIAVTSSTTYQPLDSDLTSIAGLTTTSYGRGLLTLADIGGLATGTASASTYLRGDGAWASIPASISLSDANQWTGQQSFNAASTTGSVNINPTWNNAGVSYNGLYVRATNTASGANSNVLDVGLTTGSLMRVSKDGYLFCAGGLEMGGSINQTRVAPYSGGILFYASGSIGPLISSTELRIAAGYRIAITNGNSYAGTTASVILGGAGSPEGSVTAPVGSLYLRRDGGASTCLYIKESGTGNTGWIAK